MSPAPHEVQRVKSADRALSLIDFVAEHGAVRFQEIVDMGLPKSSSHALLATLVASGWLEYSEVTHEYRLGLHAWQVAQSYDGHRSLVSAADEAMNELRDNIGETVQLARLDGIENVYIDIRRSRHPMQLVSSVGMRLHAHATGIGKALLSTLCTSEVRRRFSSVDLPSLTDRTITDIDKLITTLDVVKRKGFAVDDEEFVADCRCVAVPLANVSELGFAAALSVTMPKSRTGQLWPDEHYPALYTARVAVREALGLEI